MAAFAVPSEVVQATATADDAACDRLTVKVTVLPSAADAAATETVAVSSSVIVTLAASTVRPVVVPVTATVSRPSTVASSVGSSDRRSPCPLFEPAAMVRVKFAHGGEVGARSRGAAADRDRDRSVGGEGDPALQGPGHGHGGRLRRVLGYRRRRHRDSATFVGAVSSSVMVPVADAAVPDRLTPAGRLPPDGTARVTVKVSAPSTSTSSVVLT